ncbi:MAG: restriction endonuclease [Caulobacter sp.]|nr:restriction endonuclease [Caulobacter sp.]
MTTPIPAPFAILGEIRTAFHADLLKSGALRFKANGKANIADGSSVASTYLGRRILEDLKAEAESVDVSPQTGGKLFEKAVEAFLGNALEAMAAIAPAGLSTARLKPIWLYAQYGHLQTLEMIAKKDKHVRLAFGGDYLIKPDVVIERRTLTDDEINRTGRLVDSEIASLAALRASAKPMLHASISCKQTIRSDRSQNSRLEALNLLRNRRGRAPHIVVVTAEPLPSRIASVALGTGDFDCVYHVALPELVEANSALNLSLGLDESEQSKKLDMMIGGGRLKDIADLPLDLLL